MERTQNLDLVMMVHGWSRYKWDEMSGYAPSERVYNYERGLSIYGQIFLHEWKSVSFELFNRYTHKMEDNARFRDQPMPTDNITPYDKAFTIPYKATVDKTVNRGSSLNIASAKFTSSGRDNKFTLDFPDFEGSLSVRIDKLELTDLYNRLVTITDSEYRPKERLYDFYEVGLGQEVQAKAMLEFPSVKVRYYNRGHFSPLYDTYRTSIYEAAVHTPYTSLGNYMEYYDMDVLSKMVSYDTSVEDVVNNKLASTNEQLYYNKMLYGTVSYISTLRDVRYAVSAYQGYVTTPLDSEFLTVKWSPYSNSMTFADKGFNFVIDSTIIHTSQEKRMEIYNEYKDHEKFSVFSIKSLREDPVLASSRKCPDYVVEYVGRITYTPTISSNPIRTSSPRVVVFQGFEEERREFYSPDYSVVAPPTSGDHRRTLYWNPNVESDAEGRATVTFYNNSRGGNYTIDAQTITSDGEIGTTTK